ILAIELLLFEFRARSIIPVSLACVSSIGIRAWCGEAGAVFPMALEGTPSPGALAIYLVIGAFMGLLSVGVTKAIYAVEDWFELLPIHWMWWPALGGVAVGFIGWMAPRTLGVGYGNIDDLINNRLAVQVVAILAITKFLSWAISLGSGTSGGTLAPLLTLGGAVGAVMGTAALALFPDLHVQPGLAALVGMTALFAGASRALLASVIFGLEITHQPDALGALLAGCAAASLVSQLLMRHSIMTEKIVRRGIRVPVHYDTDPFHHVPVRNAADQPARMIPDTLTIGELADRMAGRDPSYALPSTHFIQNAAGDLCGVISRGDLLAAVEFGNAEASVLTVATTDVVVIYPDDVVQDAVEKMLEFDIGQLPVVSRDNPRQLLGILTRKGILTARKHQIDHENEVQPGWI
ncbi:MAG: chloride channel protein, partial [Candidatus Methylacidiphilales bacterium]